MCTLIGEGVIGQECVCPHGGGSNRFRCVCALMGEGVIGQVCVCPHGGEEVRHASAVSTSAI